MKFHPQSHLFIILCTFALSNLIKEQAVLPPNLITIAFFLLPIAF